MSPCINAKCSLNNPEIYESGSLTPYTGTTLIPGQAPFNTLTLDLSRMTQITFFIKFEYSPDSTTLLDKNKMGTQNCDETLSGSVGSNYIGCQTKTSSGLSCLSWDKDPCPNG